MTDKTYINIWGLKLVLHLVPFDHWLVTYYWHHGPQIFTAQLFCPRLFSSPAIVTIVPILALCPNIVSILALCRPQSLVLNLTTCAHTSVALAGFTQTCEKLRRKSLKSFGGRAAHKIPEVPTKAFADKDFPPVSMSVHRHIERTVGNVKKTMRMTTGG